MVNPQDILHQFWGFESFRGSQNEIITALLNQEDVLALMPTGGGKSLCYQVPALCTKGVCIVVSPLIALMEDQIRGLKSRGIKALGIYGNLSEEELIRKFDNALYGEYPLVYISPERLEQDLVLYNLERLKVNLIAIDEAHCISQWGYDFRPAYLKCSKLRELYPEVPLIALTATATPEVVKDISLLLGLEKARIFKDSIRRQNLIYTLANTEDKRFYLQYLLVREPGSTIIFVRTRKETTDLAEFLINKGISATFFHGGLQLADKQKNMNLWQTDKARVMVATNAFGMGVDKADVRLVIHLHLPETIEHYFQEAGRAGRDGKRAKAVLLHSPGDNQRSINYYLGNLPGTEAIIEVYRKLCNYLQIAFGELPGTSFNIAFASFCDTYNLPMILALNVLELLDRNGVISLIQRVKTLTRIKFICTKEELLEFLPSSEIQLTVNTLIRTYGGLFDFETPIQKELIRKKLNVSEKSIEEHLEFLNKSGLLWLEQHSGDLEITFLKPREDARTIHAFSKNLEKRQGLKRTKVQQMIDYVNEKEVCRQTQLMCYFGEETQIDCGFCDVCAPEKPTGHEIESLIPEVNRALSTGPKSSKDLILEGIGSEMAVLSCLQRMLEDEQIVLNPNNTYQLQ